MNNFPKEIQYAVSIVLPNFSNGCYWGFTTLKEAQNYIEFIQKEPNLTAHQIGKDCLIEINPNYLLKAIAGIGADVLKEQDIENMKEYMADAMISFERFLIRAGKEQNFENVIALYSINNTNIIQNKGISYPAFRLTITDVLKYLAVYGYLIKVNSQFVDPKTALLSGQALYDSMRVSTTKTGAFIEIKSTYSQAQIQELEALYKKKWGIN